MSDALTDFADNRDLLFTVAYEITGSAADAEDVVQESYLRWTEVGDDDRAQIRNTRAYLASIATRQALNRLRSRSRRREDYVGPWLPEPLITAPDVADDVVLAESVSMAMMLVVESLSPDERAVFVLHEVFGFAYDEIAEAIGKSVRQRPADRAPGPLARAGATPAIPGRRSRGRRGDRAVPECGGDRRPAVPDGCAGAGCRAAR